MRLFIRLTSFALFAIVYLSSCQKKPGVVTPPKEDPQCKLVYFAAENLGGFKFTYNALGNPVTAGDGGPGRTGNTNVYFIYDKYNRLSDYIGYYNITLDSNSQPLHASFEYWLRYAYADNNPASKPIGDTTRILGQYHLGLFEQPALPGNNPIGPAKTLFNKYTYDAQERITEVAVREYSALSTIKYEYDANGNLVRPNVTYDAKKNYRGRNKVLMLIDKNYSVNNPFTAASYNAEGYPVAFPAKLPTQLYHDNFLNRQVYFTTISYDCSGKSKIE